MSATPSKRILVVDDEIDVCRLVAFELPDCRVDVAVSFSEAMERFEQARYDLVILDIMGVSGFQLLERFAPSAPCIMLTGRALAASDLERAIRGKAVLYLPKDELGRLDEYVARALGTKEPLWSWLVDRLDFRRWFGSDFRPTSLPRPDA